MPAWRAKLKQMADMKKGAAPPAPRPATMADTPKNNRPRSQPAPRQGVEQMFRHFFQCPVFLGKAEEKCGHHKVKKTGALERGRPRRRGSDRLLWCPAERQS